MNIKQKKEIVEIFAECFHEIVVPYLENMATKDDIRRLEEQMATKEDIKEVREDVARIDRRLGKHEDRMDQHGKDIEKLKTKLAD